MAAKGGDKGQSKNARVGMRGKLGKKYYKGQEVVPVDIRTLFGSASGARGRTIGIKYAGKDDIITNSDGSFAAYSSLTEELTDQA